MSVTTITGLTLQFDADNATHGTPLEQARQAIEQINEALGQDDEMQAAIMDVDQITEQQVTLARQCEYCDQLFTEEPVMDGQRAYCSEECKQEAAEQGRALSEDLRRDLDHDHSMDG